MIRPGANPTLEDVARLAGVSRSTASRAINGGARVAPEALSAVQEAVRRLGYVPNLAARSLVTNRSNSIALLVPEPDEILLTDPFFAHVLRGISAVLDDADLQLLLVMARPGRGVHRAERFLTAQHADGVIVVSHHRLDRLETAAVAGQVPVVLIGRPWISDSVVSWVDSANRDGARLATEHLLARGCRRIAILAGPQDMVAGFDRRAGVHEALEAAGLAPGPEVETPFTRAGGAAAMARALSQDPTIDGVVAASDLVAAGALTTLTLNGRRVPEDVRVVGYDDLGVAAETVPPLTTVVNPAEDLGRAAARLVVERITGSARGAAYVMPPPALVVRGTT